MVLYNEETSVHKTSSLIDLKRNLYLMIARTQRKQNRLYDAIETCTNGLTLDQANDSTKYQFYHLRARCKKDIKYALAHTLARSRLIDPMDLISKRQFEAALNDLAEAERHSTNPDHDGDQSLNKLLTNRDETVL
jgi:hypothetical protein